MHWAERSPSDLGVAEPQQAGAAANACVATLDLADPARGVAIILPDLGSGNPVPARSTVAIAREDVGRSVVVVFENGDTARPIVVGVLRDQPVRGPQDVVVDGRRICLEAEDELVLQSGKSSITLGADGRIVIKGMEIVSRARGTHKVKGGTVLIN